MKAKRVYVKKKLFSDVFKRFSRCVNEVDPQKCFEWTGGRQSNGYGNLWIGNRLVGAHRVAYALYFGAVPANKLVLHKCDNPRCVNPLHLYLGTQQDNMRDRTRNGKSAASVRPKKPLQRRYVEWCIRHVPEACSTTVLSEFTGVSQRHIRYLKRKVRR